MPSAAVIALRRESPQGDDSASTESGILFASWSHDNPRSSGHLGCSVSPLLPYERSSSSTLGTGRLSLRLGGLPPPEARGPGRPPGWSGRTWPPIPDRATSTFIGKVESLASFDNGIGPSLNTRGRSVSTRRGQDSQLASWDGKGPIRPSCPAGDGTDDRVLSPRGFDGRSGPGLFVGANFALARGLPSSPVARWAWTPRPTFSRDLESVSISTWSAVCEP